MVFRGHAVRQVPHPEAPAAEAANRSSAARQEAPPNIAAIPAPVDHPTAPSTCRTRLWHADVVDHATVWRLREQLSFGDGSAAAPFPSALTLWDTEPGVVDAMSDAFAGAHLIPLGAAQPRAAT